MATILERKDNTGKAHYTVQVRLKGHAPQFATFERVTDAKKWAQQTEAAIREGRHFTRTEAKRHTFQEMVDRYKRNVLDGKKPHAVQTRTIQLDWWAKSFGHLVLADITPAMIAEAREALGRESTHMGDRRSPATVNRYLAALSHAYTIAVKEWGWIDENPMRKITKKTEPRGRVRFLSDDERLRLLAACKENPNPCMYDIVLLAMSTGMRQGEILNLTWDKVDLHRCVITLEPDDTKNGRRRAVPIVGHALEGLRERAKIRRIDSPYVFPRPYRPGLEPAPYVIHKMFVKATEHAGLRDFRFHDLRHTAASYLAMSGASLNEIAEILGHRTLQMVQRYAHLSQAHVSQVVLRMNEKMFTGKPEERAE